MARRELVWEHWSVFTKFRVFSTRIDVPVLLSIRKPMSVQNLQMLYYNKLYSEYVPYSPMRSSHSNL